MKLKRIYEYLGAADPDLNDKATARCPSCCPPDLPVVPASLTVGAVSALSSTGGQPQIVAVDETKYLIVYQQLSAPNDLMGVICNVDAGTLAVTINTPVIISAVGAQNGLDSSMNVELIDTNKVLIVYIESGTNNSVAQVLTISGNTFTAGAVNNLGIAGTKSYPQITKLTTTTAMHTYNKLSGSFFTFARVLSVAGDVVTAGAETATPTGASDGSHLARINNTSALLVHGQASVAYALRVLTVSGGLVTYGPTIFGMGDPIFQSVNVPAYMFESDPSGLTFLICAKSIFESPGNIMMRVVRVSGTDITSENSSESYEASIPSSSSEKHIRILPMDSSLGTLVFPESASGRRLYCATYRYTTSAMTPRIAPTLVHNGISDNPDTAKLNKYRLAWVCKDGSNNIKTGVVRVT